MVNIRGVVRARWRSVLGAIALAAVFLGLFVCWWCLLPQRYQFDATKAHTPQELGWSASGSYVGRSTFELRFAARRRVATVALPGGLQSYEEPRVARMFLEAPGGKLRKLIIAGLPMSIDDALDRVQYWSRMWKFDTPGIDQWRTQTQHGYLGNYSAGRFAKSPGSMDVWFEIWPSYNSQRPWYVALNIYWHPEGG